MITIPTIDNVVRNIIRMNRELCLGECEIIGSQRMFYMLYEFVSRNGFKVHHKKMFYMGLIHRKGRKNMQGDFSVKYICKR